ncbi:tripartite tricarboxylate transporter TctB family protein [Georgenia alba]|uniref:Tripartite tricarboxylate transporter TctB family protein n=1 Tax=Georgenia alba TaxID=2233858 RepID=A0ABW2Q4X0_9MICO
MSDPADADVGARGRRAKVSDVVGTAVLGVVGLGAAIAGLGYGMLGDDGRIGPGFLPVAAGGFLVVAAAAEIARLYLAAPGHGRLEVIAAAASAVRAERDPADPAGHSDADDPVERADGMRDTGDQFGRTARQRERAVLAIFALMLVAVLLVPVVGLLIAVGLMVLALVAWMERRGLLAGLAVSVVAVGLSYLVFVVVLGVPLPTGLLGWI